MVRTINELSQLGHSDFNQPPPRHGLNLLYWFAQNINQLNPAASSFGFHLFHNRIDDEDDDDGLLPNQNDPYYEVGNLNSPGAEKLPWYVRQSKKHYGNEWNTDRIIVLMRNGRINRVYVTEHRNHTDFNPNRTYRVSMGLLDQIKRMQREQFLKCMDQQRVPAFTSEYARNLNDVPVNMTSQSSHRETESSRWWCTIL